MVRTGYIQYPLELRYAVLGLRVDHINCHYMLMQNCETGVPRPCRRKGRTTDYPLLAVRSGREAHLDLRQKSINGCFDTGVQGLNVGEFAR